MPTTGPNSRLTLASPAAYLEHECYTPVEQICQRAEDCITEIHGGDPDQTASIYTTLCNRLIEYVRSYIRLRRFFWEGYIVWIATAAEIGCESQLKEMEEEIRHLLDKINSVVPPVAHETFYPNMDEALRSEIRKLEKRLSEMFYLEQTALTSKILDAENIHLGPISKDTFSTKTDQCHE